MPLPLWAPFPPPPNKANANLLLQPLHDVLSCGPIAVVLEQKPSFPVKHGETPWAQPGRQTPSWRGASVSREAGDLLEIADGGVAAHAVLLLDVFKFRGVDVHPGQHLGAKGEQTCPLSARRCPHLVHACPAVPPETDDGDEASQSDAQPGAAGEQGYPSQLRTMPECSGGSSHLGPRAAPHTGIPSCLPCGKNHPRAKQSSEG